MPQLSSSLLDSRLVPPEIIWLEPEQIERAKRMSDLATDEERQWQQYLSALALLAFEQWFHDRLPELSHKPSIARSPQNSAPQESPQSMNAISYFESHGFTFCLITVDHVLDEIIRIPQVVVEQPELAAHFYVVHEVSEEQEFIILRGFCRYDELAQNCHSSQTQDGHYLLPLAQLDPEPNHLLVYCRWLQPSAIALPARTSINAPARLLEVLTNTTTSLTQWLQGTVDEGWQMIDQLINPETYLAFSTRSLDIGVRRGKLLNCGIQLGQQMVVLLVTVTEEAEEKLNVLVQLYPTGNTQYLIPNLKLSLRSQTDRTLQEVISRSQDNYIQLKAFKGKPGTHFKIVIYLGDERLEENFEL